MSNVRHVLGISGGKDSAALAIYLTNNYPELDIEFYCCDTGRELDETYQLIDNLESQLAIDIKKLKAVDNDKLVLQNGNDDKKLTPFDYYLESYRGFLPSSQARWCTKNLKLKPFEEYVGDDPAISYVGIRGDEDREAYISTKPNIQSIFPYRKNIWSVDVISLVLDNHNIGQLRDIYESKIKPDNLNRLIEEIEKPVTKENNLDKKVNILLDLDTIAFNEAVFEFLKKTDYPVGQLEEFPLIYNTDIIVRDEVFRMLEESGVGVPKYYEKREYEVDGETGTYARTRSGCFFCFFQQKIEWVWLYENNPEKFEKAQSYEKEGFTWMDNESLEELAQPERRKKIKRDHLKKQKRRKKQGSNSNTLLSNLLEENEKGEYFDKEEEDYTGCTICFI